MNMMTDDDDNNDVVLIENRLLSEVWRTLFGWLGFLDIPMARGCFWMELGILVYLGQISEDFLQ